MPGISEPITFHHSGKTAQNRTLKSAMTERLCEWSEDDVDSRGKPTKEYIELYRQWGKGALGVCVLGNIPVDRRYPEAKGNAIIDKTSSWDAVEAFKPVIEAARGDGALVIAQLTHAGRQTPKDVAPEPVSASDVQSGPMGGMTFGKPRPMTIDEIHDFSDRMAFASKVMYDAGADGVQMHAAHGYALSQFLSPRVNKRTDQYGGSLENRSRILFETIDAIRKVVPDKKFILSIKINSADFSDGGFSPEDSKETVIKLEQAGLDLIEMSGGTYESLAFEHKKESTVKREAYFLEFAQQFRPHLRTAKLAVTGGFRSAQAMSQAIEEGSCDIVGMARPLTAEPHLSRELIEKKKEAAKENKVPQPIQTPAAIAQLGDIGHGKAPRDYSDDGIAKEFAKSMGM